MHGATAPRRAAILAVGSELLTPFRTDSNSLAITSALNDLGIRVVWKAIVGDQQDELAGAVRHALSLADLLVLTGGLGPTDDDVTREAVAEALGLPLEEHEAIAERLRARFAARGLEMPAINRRQAKVIGGATILPNANGTAPGQWIAAGGRYVLLLPGPPREMRPMLAAVLAAQVAPLVKGARVMRRVVKIAGRPESWVEERAHQLYGAWRERVPPIEESTLASPGQVELHLSVVAPSEAEGHTVLQRAVDELLAVFEGEVFSTDGRSLEEVVGDLLRRRGWRVALAESCTGGLACSRLTDVPGSSDYVERGFVTYSNRAKTELLGVGEELFAAHGAVSEAVAEAMAAGARARAGVEIAVGITGIAGPGGGSREKPVGTVAIAVAWPGGGCVERYRFTGDRQAVKFQASQAALTLLRKRLEQV
ncbi:MAG: competence/damage-inducible protein A [Acidobacteria bacterium]|jgi:nicotinamide-nucleotide amidase|nr:competence/damage-inducible protein A [Acidobacteriota bacterium]